MVGMLIKLRSSGNKIYNGLVSKCYLDVDYCEDVCVELHVIWNDGDVTYEEIHKQHNEDHGKLFFYHNNKWLDCSDYIDIMIEIIEQSEEQ